MLRRLLFLNLLPFVAMLLATGVYAIVLFSRLAATIDTAVAENYRSVVATQRMSLALAGMDREGWPSSPRNGVDRAFVDYQKRFDANLALQLKSTSLPGEKDLNEQLTVEYSRYRRGLEKLTAAATPKAKYRVYDLEIVPRTLEMKVLLEKILEVNQRAILATSGRVQQITHSVNRLMIIGMIIALSFSVYAWYQLTSSVLRPIKLVTKATRELGSGNLKEPVPVLSRDELGELAVAFNNLASQLQEYRQSTTEEVVRLHRTMETTLGSFPDPIFVLDKEGRIELQNPAAADLGATLNLRGQLPARLQAIAQKTLAGGEHFLPHSFKEVVSYRLNGTEKYYLPRILTMRNPAKAVAGVAVVLYDVTRFRLLDAAKTDLVATVSHELKTPLTSVRMVLHILLEGTAGALTVKQGELVQAARTDAERSLRILDDLLDLARLEEGDSELRREMVPSAELLRAAIDETAESATAKGVNLVCSSDRELPSVAVDRARINYVFTNLIGNAIKHSASGGTVLLRAARAAGDWVEFTVKDDGPGIPREHLTRIFDRFFRVPGQAKPGAGLGLSIAREITVAHGGRIAVRSAEGVGTTFCVSLKAAEGVGGSQTQAALAQQTQEHAFVPIVGDH